MAANRETVLRVRKEMRKTYSERKIADVYEILSGPEKGRFYFEPVSDEVDDVPEMLGRIASSAASGLVNLYRGSEEENASLRKPK